MTSHLSACSDCLSFSIARAGLCFTMSLTIPTMPSPTHARHACHYVGLSFIQFPCLRKLLNALLYSHWLHSQSLVWFPSISCSPCLYSMITNQKNLMSQICPTLDLVQVSLIARILQFGQVWYFLVYAKERCDPRKKLQTQ